MWCLLLVSGFRAVIIPVMERVLGPYLRGGGAKAFNFQVSPALLCCMDSVGCPAAQKSLFGHFALHRNTCMYLVCSMYGLLCTAPARVFSLRVLAQDL